MEVCPNMIFSLPIQDRFFSCTYQLIPISSVGCLKRCIQSYYSIFISLDTAATEVAPPAVLERKPQSPIRQKRWNRVDWSLMERLYRKVLDKVWYNLIFVFSCLMSERYQKSISDQNNVLYEYIFCNIKIYEQTQITEKPQAASSTKNTWWYELISFPFIVKEPSIVFGYWEQFDEGEKLWWLKSEETLHAIRNINEAWATTHGQTLELFGAHQQCKASDCDPEIRKNTTISWMEQVWANDSSTHFKTASDSACAY